MESELSVVIPCHNIMDFASRLEGTVSEFTTRGIQVILIENNSRDETLPFLLNRFKGENEIVLTTDKTGAPAARNMGLEFVTTPFVKFFDADDIPIPSLLRNHLTFLKTQGADFSTSLHYTGKSKNRLDVNFRHPFNDSIAQCILSGTIGVTSGAIFRTTALKLVNGFSESLTSNQERDLFWRLFLSKAKYVSFPCFTFIKILNHKGISSTISKKERMNNVHALNVTIMDFLAQDNLDHATSR